MNRTLTAKYSTQLGFSFNTTLGDNLIVLRNAVLNQDFDAAILVDGPEGSGKSVFGMQIGVFLDIERSIDIDTQVCWYPEQFQKAVQTLKKGRAIIWDEARRGANRRRSIKEVNLIITDMLAECRQNNLFLIVIMPTFYDMDMNIAVWRSRALVHVWYAFDKNNEREPLVRGFFRFYNEEGKKRLYTNKQWRQQYEYPFLNNMAFEGSFTHHYVVDEKDYRRKKRESQYAYTKQASPPVDDMPKKRFAGMILRLLMEGNKDGRSYLRQGWQHGLAQKLEITEKTIYNWINNNQNEAISPDTGSKEDQAGNEFAVTGRRTTKIETIIKEGEYI